MAGRASRQANAGMDKQWQILLFLHVQIDICWFDFLSYTCVCLTLWPYTRSPRVHRRPVGHRIECVSRSWWNCRINANDSADSRRCCLGLRVFDWSMLLTTHAHRFCRMKTRRSKQSLEKSNVCYFSFVLLHSCLELFLVLNDCSCFLCIRFPPKYRKTRENGQEGTVT